MRVDSAIAAQTNMLCKDPNWRFGPVLPSGIKQVRRYLLYSIAMLRKLGATIDRISHPMRTYELIKCGTAYPAIDNINAIHHREFE